MLRKIRNEREKTYHIRVVGDAIFSIIRREFKERNDLDKFVVHAAADEFDGRTGQCFIPARGTASQADKDSAR